MQDQQLSLLPDISITSRSLELPSNCSRELWEDCGTKIGVCVDAGQFIIGDWLNEGIKRYGISLGSFLKSDAARQMPGISSFSYDSLNSFVSVMDKIPSTYRVKGVSFAHHQAASKLIRENKPEQRQEAKKWLVIAKEKSLSLREMAFAINGRAQLTDITKKAKSNSTRSNLPIKKSLSDLALSINRELIDLNHLFDPTKDPISEWSPDRRQSAIVALEPVMDQIGAITDHFIELRK